MGFRVENTCKIFEIAVLKRFSFVNECFNLIDPYNGVFINGSSTADNILILLSCIQSQLAKNTNLYLFCRIQSRV